MPAKFMGKSECHKHYKWKPSLSKQAVEQFAGASPSVSQPEVQFEPCFQRKKKTEGPTTTLSFNFISSDKTNDDYILLGKNTKFNENIRYKCRPIKPFENPQANVKENSPILTRLPETSPRANNEYILLGNNSKFANNIVYKPRSCPEVVIIDKDQEKPSNDGFDYANEPKKILEDNQLYNFGGDYILLGSNAKFSSNVPYKSKVWRDFKPSHDKEKENAPADDDAEDFPYQAKILDPPPVIDTSKFREPPKKSKKAIEKSDDSEIKIKKKRKSSALHQEGAKEELKLPLDDLPSASEAIDGKTAAEKEGKNAFNEEKGEVSNCQAVSSEKNVKFQSPPPAPRSEREAQIQQNNDKKLLSLLHKAGIRLPPRTIVEQSEYQKNFTWKKPLPFSDSAENNRKIFQTTSICHTHPSHQDSAGKTTEYQRNFQAWAPLSTKPAPPPATIEKTVAHSGHDVQKDHAARSSRIEKTSNAGSASSPKEDRQDACSVVSNESADKIRQENNVRRTESIESISSSTKTKLERHRESQCINSEYRENFRAPSKYDYRTSAWNMNRSNDDVPPPQKDYSGKGDWYSEVLDLRQKASEYRNRANNTHFSADHMAQLLADETRLWEGSKSDRPVTAKADVRFMRPAGISYRQHSPSAQNRRLYSNSHTASPWMTLEDVTDDADVASVHSEPQADTNCVPTSSEIDVVPAAPPQEINGDEAPLQIGEDVVTPEFQKEIATRHHLDRTTPIKGALLISPATYTQKIDSEISNNPDTAEPHDPIEPHSTASDAELKPKHCVQTCALPSKTFGKPSKDSHILRAQENISNSTKTLSQPSFGKSSEISTRDTSNITMRSGNRRPKKSEAKQHPAGLDNNRPIPESMISPYNSEPPQRVDTDQYMPNEKSHLDEDFLNQSLESNNSLASEVLERTRKRLNFW